MGSDQTTLILDTRDYSSRHFGRFYFEAPWLEIEDFIPSVSAHIIAIRLTPHHSLGPLDDWNFLSQSLRHFLKGWSANLAAESKANKLDLLG